MRLVLAAELTLLSFGTALLCVSPTAGDEPASTHQPSPICSTGCDDIAAVEDRVEGSIVGWGLSVPAKLPCAVFQAVEAGDTFSLGLTASGSIIAWGYNSSGQTSIPAPNRDFVAAATGGYHGLGLKADGSIVAWGRNDQGQTDVPEANYGFTAIQPVLTIVLGLRLMDPLSHGGITATVRRRFLCQIRASWQCPEA